MQVNLRSGKLVTSHLLRCSTFVDAQSVIIMCFYTRGFDKVLCLSKENVPSVGTIDWWFCGECFRLILCRICVWECVIVLANVVHVVPVLSIRTQDAKHIYQKLGLDLTL